MFDRLLETGALSVIVVLAIVISFLIVMFISPCHGSFFDFNKGRFCSECGAERYKVCECGQILSDKYCSDCGRQNPYWDE